jgi:3-isopropylmalate dehydratase small subunit
MGKALVLVNNIDTDQIYPGCFLALVEPEEIGKHCLLICKGAGQKIKTGNELVLDISAGQVTIRDSGETLQSEKLGEHILNIIHAGGIKPMFRKNLQKNLKIFDFFQFSLDMDQFFR